MKKFLLNLVAAALLFSTTAFALTDGDEFILNNSGSAANVTRLGSRLKEAGTVVATWNPSLITAHRSTIAAGIKLGQTLPKNAVITRSFIRILTPVTYAGVGSTSTLAFSCEDANNIFTATDIRPKAAGNFIEGASTGASTAFVANIAADCQITALVGGDQASTGKVQAYISYVISE